MEQITEKLHPENEVKYCVYIHRNKVNNKAYIGITSKNPEERWGNNGYNYRKNQPVFYKAINKYGWDKFEHIIFANGLSKSDATNMEIKLIALFKTNCKRYKNPEYGYNMTDGGEGNLGLVHSDETKKLIGDKAKERCSILENCSMYGKHHSEESKKKMSEMRQGVYVGENNPFYGKQHSDESKQKMREYALNRPEEVNQKISQKTKERLAIKENNPRYGKPMSDKQRQKISESQSKPVVQLSKNGVFLAEYKSYKHASLETGVNKASIARCCRGEARSAGGFLWIAKEEYNPNKTYEYVNTKLKPVVQIDRFSKFVAEYISYADAERTTGVSSSDIRECCNGNHNSAGGFLWMHKEDYNPDADIVYKGRNQKRKIIQYDTQWNRVGEYYGCTQAGKETGFDRHGIADCCEGKREEYCGFYWRYEDKDTIRN